MTATRGPSGSPRRPAAAAPGETAHGAPVAATEENEDEHVRWNVSATARRVLERSFRIEPYPQAKERERLAAQFGATSRQVQVWFQNRRVREQKTQAENERRRLARLAAEAHARNQRAYGIPLGPAPAQMAGGCAHHGIVTQPVCTMAEPQRYSAPTLLDASQATPLANTAPVCVMRPPPGVPLIAAAAPPPGAGPVPVSAAPMGWHCMGVVPQMPGGPPPHPAGIAPCVQPTYSLPPAGVSVQSHDGSYHPPDAHVLMPMAPAPHYAQCGPPPGEQPAMVQTPYAHQGMWCAQPMQLGYVGAAPPPPPPGHVLQHNGAYALGAADGGWSHPQPPAGAGPAPQWCWPGHCASAPPP